MDCYWYIVLICHDTMAWPHLISDEAEGRGEDPAGGGEVKVQRYKADHEVGDGGDARQGSHSPVDAAACIQTKKEKYI